MKGKKDVTEIILEIKNKNPFFNREDFLDYTKSIIPILYNDLKNGNSVKTKNRCKEDIIYKLLQNKSKYRIITDMDHISIQYAELFDYLEENDEIYVKVYISVHFYDNVKNNKIDNRMVDGFWNDIWIITYKNLEKNYNINNLKCQNCGAIMKYSLIKKILECNYCGNELYYRPNMNWEIVDIEVME